MTKLEERLFANVDYAFLRSVSGSPAEIQAVLDRISDMLCDDIDPIQLLAHNRVVYEETALQYAQNTEHEHIPDALIAFMNKLRNNDMVLDIGCGTGRDAVFMAISDRTLRKCFMGRMKDGKAAHERFGIPRKSFFALGIDASPGMVRSATAFAEAHGLTRRGGEAPRAEFLCEIADMHFLRTVETVEGLFDGVWSSAALFMHTPQQCIAPALEGVAHVLRRGGVFGVSYFNSPIGVSYNNLRYSRTGEIKYFSRPQSAQIVLAAESAGLCLIEESLSDLEMAGTLKKDFFISQLFRKK
ncbi:MAG: hypothetical protein A2845_01180 [Candidatus Lloydbacteria bacterium RIFCSPHIGHO2_01_FULL_49_22]|uniref:Uncharacterized protein n=1 Tax=Candidatus Lloydbacteria bacterium RIFCSPHIGHO2_01_FULL_49_22 TaxID=1798658 RepID=A0A1G2CWK6_9BACT|nr:MAG: hypothetical protein A2845_01180 [Candidatus Lloydbacteria bacterium RIFCSPHIGHO2_01_FULL_49_22]OGZ09235.1 MAG: hypothetical protein A3C14_06185 [Candidatus Lloydbacteria bacterium RIFCSPHIGHO2_02_FULL_50_18]